MSLLGFQIVDLNWLLFSIIQSIWPTCFKRPNKLILLSVTAILILQNDSSYLLFTKLSYNGFCACTVPRITHLHLSNSLVATNLGVRLIGDVKQVLQHRKESTGDMEAQLTNLLVLPSARTTLLNWSLVWHCMDSFPSNIDLRMCFFLNNICMYKNKC